MMITDHNGEIRSAREWLGFERHKTFRDALITHQYLLIKKTVVCREPMMKDIWCLACSDGALSTRQAIEYYGKRWSTEASYRDEKNIVFGMGMKNCRIRTTARRDRLFLISALVIIVLTLLGAASEAVGFDKYIRANTSTRRTHSLFAQGAITLRLIENMAWKHLRPILEQFDHLLTDSKNVTSVQYII